MPSPRWQKVRSDLSGNKMRTFLVVASITIGVFAIGTITGVEKVLSGDLVKAYSAANPAGATFSTDSFDEELLDTVSRIPDVGLAEGRRTLTARISLGADQTRSFLLTAMPRHGEMLINRIEPQGGAWPPPERQVLLERSSADYLNASIGQSLQVELPNGKTRFLTVAGIVHDISLSPTFFSGQVYGYVDADTLEWLGAPSDYTVLNIVVASNATDIQHVEAVAKEVRDKIEDSGRTVYYMYVPEPGKHPLDSSIRTFLWLLGALGLLSLFLSGFLVVNTISAMLAQQVRQIGVMKVIGAQTHQLLAMYVILVLSFGVIAVVCGVPMGFLGAYAGARYLGSILNFDISGFSVPYEGLVVQAVVGLGVPLIAGLYPIVRSTRTTAREAMSDYGLGHDRFGESRFDHLLERIRGISTSVLISVRNTFRRKGRLALTLITLTMGGAIFIAVFSVRESTSLTLDDALRYFNFDVEMDFTHSYTKEYLENEAMQVSGVTEAEALGVASVRRKRPDKSDGSTATMLALSPKTGMIRPIVLEGRWLLPGEDNAVVVNSLLLNEESDVKVGDNIVFKIGSKETSWRVVGIVRGVMTGPVVYVNYSYYARYVPDGTRVNTLWVSSKAHDPASQLKLSQTLASRFRVAGVPVTSVQSTADVRATVETQFGILVAFLLFMAVLMAAVGALGVMGTMGLNVLERRREVGIMRAIGATDGTVRQVFLVEGILIGILSWFVGTVLAIPISSVISDAVGLAFIQAPLSYKFSLTGTLLWLLIVVVLTAVASLVPARNAARLSVREVLAYE